MRLFSSPTSAPRGNAARACAHLRALTADNADQQRRIDALEPLLADRLKRLSELIDLRRARDPLRLLRRSSSTPARRAGGGAPRCRGLRVGRADVAAPAARLARARGQLAAAVLASGGVLAAILLSVAVVVIGARSTAPAGSRRSSGAITPGWKSRCGSGPISWRVSTSPCTKTSSGWRA